MFAIRVISIGEIGRLGFFHSIPLKFSIGNLSKGHLIYLPFLFLQNSILLDRINWRFFLYL